MIFTVWMLLGGPDAGWTVVVGRDGIPSDQDHGMVPGWVDILYRRS